MGHDGMIPIFCLCFYSFERGMLNSCQCSLMVFKCIILTNKHSLLSSIPSTTHYDTAILVLGINYWVLKAILKLDT